MPRRHIDPAVKAAATAEALAGGSTRAIARKYAISHQAVHLWRHYRYGHQKAEQVNARLFTLILEGLDTLTEHVRLTRDPAYVHAQSAHDLAILDGVLADKLLLLLRAVQAGDGTAAEPAAPALPAPPDGP